MVYLIEHKNYKNVPVSSAFVCAFFAEHAKDIYEFIVDIKEDDIIDIFEIGDGTQTVYVEINRFDEFVSYSSKKFEPKKGGKIIEFTVDDSITDVHQITKTI